MRSTEALYLVVGIVIRRNAFLFGVGSLWCPECHAMGHQDCRYQLSRVVSLIVSAHITFLTCAHRFLLACDTTEIFRILSRIVSSGANHCVDILEIIVLF